MTAKEIRPSCSAETHAELLAVAALFHGPFSIDWIQEITHKKATQILWAFETAVQEGMLKRDGIGTFRYANNEKRRKGQAKLTEAEKNRCYRLIVDMLCRELPDLETKAETLAPYLLQLTNDINGCKWLMAAAGGYHQNFKIETALQCYSKILDDLAGLSGRGTDQLFCDAALQYSKLTTARHETRRVLAILEEAMVRAKNQGDYRYQSLLDMHFAKNKWLQSQYSSAVKHFEQAWSVAKDLEDEQLLRATATFKTFFLFWQGRFKEAVRDYEKVVPDVDKFPHGRFPLLAAMTIGTCYGKIGQVTQGIGMIDAVRRHCLKRGDDGLAAHSGICIGAIMLDSGCVDEACRHLIPAVEQAKTAHPDWTMIQGELVLAYAYYLQGKHDLCRVQLTRYTRHVKKVQVSVRTWPYLMELCWAIETGRLAAVPGMSVRDEIRRMLKGKNIFLKGVALRFQSFLQQQEGKSSDTLIKTLKRSSAFLETSGHAIELAKSRLALARLYLLQEERDRAVQTAEPAFKVLCATNKNLIPDDLKPLIRQTTVADTNFKEIVRFIHELAAIDQGKDMIQHILATANHMIGAERGGLLLCEDVPEGHRFHLRASKNLTETQIAHADFETSMQMMADVVMQGKGRIEGGSITGRGDMEVDAAEVNIRSRICAPVVRGKKTLGVLYHDNRLLGSAFDESQLEVLAYFATQAALALGYDGIEQKNKRLKKQLRDFTIHCDKQNRRLSKTGGEDLIGASAVIKHLLAQVKEVAPTSATVMILGETGVGKGVIAKTIQADSKRKDQPFISLNCNALSEALIYSELFGHERGAFTGADRQHIGRFEKADQGTLFLDEIGDLSADVQVRLLRVLETKEFERVGGTTTLRSDFRLIVATNTDLFQAIKEKKFREDLFYRLNVFSIYVPPLRDRREDIPLLVDHFLKIQAIETGKVFRPVSEAEMETLMKYHWPGNVRELRNITERYAISGASSSMNIVDALYSCKPSVDRASNAVVTLKENERRHILWALRQTRGKIHGRGGAAELLDIHPNTLSFRMKKLNIKKPQFQN